MENTSLLSENTNENIYHCIKCGLCLAHCPVYKEVLLEEASPRGKVQLSKLVTEGTMPLSEEIKGVLYDTCLLCGSCVAYCPSGVHGTNLFSGLRWRATQRYGTDWKKKVFFQIVSSKWKMSKLAWFGEWARRNFGGPWIEGKVKAGALTMEGIPALNKKPFSHTIEEVIKPKGETKARVLYFHGCATEYLYGDIGHAVVDVLPRMGVEVTIPKEQACCGLPIFLSGDRDTSLKSIRQALTIFSGKDVDAVIVDCATCGAALKNEYPHLLREFHDLGLDVSADEVKAAEELAGKVKDVTVFINEHMDWLPPVKGLKKKIRVTYHDPCHLVKGQKVSAQPRNILRALPNVEFVELKGADDCCGGGGSFQVEHPEISFKITKRKIDNIYSADAEVVATCCPSCNLTIGAHLDSKKGVKVMHPVQLLQAALNGK
jgi:glycolate oxidase iron-sulfur subunit